MVNCAVANCKNTSAKTTKSKDGITFHRFPQDIQRRKRWEVAVNRDKGWASTKSSAVCSDHFDTNAFYVTSKGLRRLSSEAIPAINISICEQPQATISITTPDIAALDSDRVIKLLSELQRVKILAESRKSRIKVMWQKQKRMLAEMNKMKLIIQHLVQNKNKGKT